MFINCPYCNALVATDPATDAPPERCPRCASVLRRPPEAVAEFVVPLLPASAAPVPAVDEPLVDEPAVDKPAADEPLLDQPVADAPDASVAPPAKMHIRYVFRAPVVAPVASTAPVDAPPVEPVRVAAAQLEANIAHAALVQQVLSDKADAHAASESAGAALKEQAALQAQAAALEAAKVLEAEAVEAKAETAGQEAAREPGSADGPASAAGEVEVPLPMPAIEPAAAQADAEGARIADATPTADPSTTHSSAKATTARPSPSFARRKPSGARAQWPGWRTSTALAALALLLLAQLVLADRDALAADPRWRPAIVGLCGTLGCSVPAWHEPSAITLLARDVRPHPGEPGVLRVTLSLRNDARWAQAWPTLQLTLADVDGRPAGTRAFTAREYLGAAPAQPLLAPGQVASVAMDVVEPAPRIVAFTFDFH